MTYREDFILPSGIPETVSYGSIITLVRDRVSASKPRLLSKVLRRYISGYQHQILVF
jgi:hypothetical protein